MGFLLGGSINNDLIIKFNPTDRLLMLMNSPGHKMRGDITQVLWYCRGARDDVIQDAIAL